MPLYKTAIVMAVEIRELVIKAIITDDQSAEDVPTDLADSSTDRDQIVQECVNQVLKILNKSKNR